MTRADRARKWLGTPSPTIAAGAAMLAAAAYYTGRRWPYESSIVIHLALIPLVSAAATYWRPRSFLVIGAACVAVHLAGFSAYLPVSTKVMAQMAAVVAGNIALCALASRRNVPPEPEPARLPVPKPGRHAPETFLVAFSLAGEQRPLVRAVAEAVEKRLGPSTVFYDEWYEYYIAGSDGDLRLQDIYGKRCKLAVVCVSQNYNDKPWTQVEHQAIRARNMIAGTSRHEADRLGILPLRFGAGDVQGILFNTILPDVRERTPEETATLIVDRLRQIAPDTIPRP